ncbi:Aste57867_9906 [Aphanomyces stellatus]|uniref:Aste57867_9906 protein n=1 Tax=Aphanomyces stellatus TaxID=120398 RepID=A0A485KPP0_9STRA|nr:hypothetical protein As57867_009867 [Aphanomyces stellatus]VFT86785.1 Aste57867_9906 [Aphanomyces stellatus]
MTAGAMDPPRTGAVKTTDERAAAVDDGHESDDSDVVIEKVVAAPQNTLVGRYGGYYSPTRAKRGPKKRKVLPKEVQVSKEQLGKLMLLKNDALSMEIRSMYGQVAWCHLRGWPYWPGYVCNPLMLTVDDETMKLFVPKIETHYWIYFYNCNKGAAVPHAAVVAWDDTSKPFREGYPRKGPNSTVGLWDAIALADKEFHLPANDRVAWVLKKISKKDKERQQGQKQENKPSKKETIKTMAVQSILDLPTIEIDDSESGGNLTPPSTPPSKQLRVA